MRIGKHVDFIGIGVQKAATSWIFQCILEHPAIRAGKDKESNFFNFRYHAGYSWYHNRFEFGNWLTGEFSTLYFYDANIPRRIYHYNPEVKLLLCLRNPVDRAYSQHQHEVRRNRLPEELYDFDNALLLNPSYLEQGLYASHLKRFLQFFDLNQIHVIIYDDITADPQSVLFSLYRFLEVDTSFQPNFLNKKVNIARTYRSHTLDTLFRSAKSNIQKLIGDNGIEMLKRTKIHNIYRKYNEIPQEPILVPPMKDKTARELYRYFSDEIQNLEGMIHRNLSTWHSS